MFPIVFFIQSVTDTVEPLGRRPAAFGTLTCVSNCFTRYSPTGWLIKSAEPMNVLPASGPAVWS
jgi:hypothetical protein